MKRLIFIAFTGILCMLLFSCNVQKRLYRKGLYIDWHAKNTGLSLQNAEKTQRIVSHLFQESFQKEQQPNLTSSQNNQIIFSLPKSMDVCADTLVFISGDEKVVKILEITENEIKYKKCDYLDGPVYTVSKNKIYMVKYSNGNHEYFTNDTQIKNNDSEFDYGYQTKKNPGSSTDDKNKIKPRKITDSVIALILGLIASFIPILAFQILSLAALTVALFWARESKRIILRNPDKYKGKGLANFLMYFNLILWILSLIGSLIGLSYASAAKNIQYLNAFTVSLIISALVLLIFFITSKAEDF